MPHKIIGGVVASAITILAAEGCLLAFWMATGIYMAAVPEGKDLLISHVAGSLHFAITVVICLVLEHYLELRKIKRRHQANRAATAEADVPNAYYLLSWFVPVVVAVGTDAFMLTAAVRDYREERGAVQILEYVCCAWAIVDAGVATLWSVWVFALSRMLSNKLAVKTSKY